MIEILWDFIVNNIPDKQIKKLTYYLQEYLNGTYYDFIEMEESADLLKKKFNNYIEERKNW